MANNHIQPGKVLDYTNATGAAIASGAVVPVGTILGVALSDIAVGVHCRIGSSETRCRNGCTAGWVHCRIGSSEKSGQSSG